MRSQIKIVFSCLLFVLYFLLPTAYFLLPTRCFAQPITFEKWYNFGYTENGFSVQPTFDGGYIVSGRHGISINVSDLLLMKTDSLGVNQWTKFIHTGQYEHEGYDVKQTADSGYVITGMIEVMGGGANVYLVKTDKNGDTLWTKNYGSAAYDRGWSVQTTFDGGYIVSAEYDTLAMLLKPNSNGDTLWTKKYLPLTAIASSGYSVQQMNDSGFIFSGNAVYASPPCALYIVRTDKNGDTLWTKQYFGNGWQWGRSISKNSDGGFIVSGWTGAVNNDCYLLRTNSLGDTLWTKTFGGAGDDGAMRALETSDGGFVFAGITSSFGAGNYDMYLVKTDSNGNFIWQKTFGRTGGDNSYDMDLTSDGGFVLTGGSDNGSFQPMGGVYLVKTNSNGVVITGINEPGIRPEEINIIPNPLSDKSILFLNENTIGEVSFYNVLGEKIFEKEFVKELSLSRNDFYREGIYFYRINTKTNSRNSKLLVQ